MSDSRPVGFFDSGIGGRCILDAFKRRCPRERTVYIADREHCPYGNRPREEIIALADACTRRLIAADSKLVVVACNTATAAAIDILRERYAPLPFVGLEPAVKPAALESRSGIVAVLATAGTFNGRLYRETKAKFAAGVTVIAAVADEFVEAVEKLDGRDPCTLAGEERVRLRQMVQRKIEPLVAAGADHIVLGCTHFPHLIEPIREIAGPHVKIVDPSDAVAVQIERMLAARDALAP